MIETMSIEILGLNEVAQHTLWVDTLTPKWLHSIKSFSQRNRLCYFKKIKEGSLFQGTILVITPSVLFLSLPATWVKIHGVFLEHLLHSEQWAQYDIYHHIPETDTIIPKLPMRKPRLTVLTETGKATGPGFEPNWSTCKAYTPNCHMILPPWHGRWVRWQKEGKEVPSAKSGTQEW